MRPIFHSIVKVQKVQIQFSRKHGLAYEVTIKLGSDIRKLPDTKQAQEEWEAPKAVTLDKGAGQQSFVHLFLS